LADALNTEAVNDAVIDLELEAGAEQPVTRSKWFRVRKDGKLLLFYLLDSEVHTFAFSVAANAILSFIPFIVLLYMLARSVFHSEAMVSVINDLVRYFVPSAAKDPNFLADSIGATAALLSSHGVQFFSLVMILIACTGIFLPLEIALNQAWGVVKSRNYLYNQAVAVALALLMVALGMGSVYLNASARYALSVVLFHHVDNFFFRGISFVLLVITTGIASILFFFSVYWVLPNRKVPWRPVFRTAVVTGIIWQISKYIFLAVLPYLDLKALYGPFFISVGLLFWAYTSGLILFAGAQFSVSRWSEKNHNSGQIAPL
jgi:YihY family inner membrane protein